MDTIPLRTPELCEGKREICGETQGADLVILEQTERLCLVVTPGDHAPGITPNTNEPKNSNTKSPRTSKVRRAGEASSMCLSKEVKSTMVTASYKYALMFRSETSIGLRETLYLQREQRLRQGKLLRTEHTATNSNNITVKDKIENLEQKSSQHISYLPRTTASEAIVDLMSGLPIVSPRATLHLARTQTAPGVVQRRARTTLSNSKHLLLPTTGCVSPKTANHLGNCTACITGDVDHCNQQQGEHCGPTTVGPQSASAPQQEMRTTLSKKENCGNCTVNSAVWTKAPEAITTGKTPETGTAPVESPQASPARATKEGNTHTGAAGENYGQDHGICRNDQDFVQEPHL